MVAQVDLDLNKPLDADAQSIIARVAMNPSLALLALTLHGDYYRQLQSKCNRRIVWDPLLQLVLVTLFVGITAYIFRDIYQIADSFGEFLSLLWANKFALTNLFPALIIIGGFIGVITFTITDEFRNMSDVMSTDEAMAKVFRFPLRIYANARESDMDSTLIESGSRSTDLIMYRNSPIAVITVVPEPEKSSDKVFYAKITGLHVRKSYAKAGLEEDLLQYAKAKALELSEKYAKDNKFNGKKIKTILLADAYTVDPVLPALYLRNGFKVTGSSYHINSFQREKNSEKIMKIVPLSVLYKFFSIQRLSYELELNE